MSLTRSVRRLFQVSLFAIAMTFGTVSSAHALTFTLNWTGNSGASLTGTFTGTDVDGDDVINGRGTNNEVTAFDITFRDSTNAELASYNLTQLLGFTPDFNFNYSLVSPVGVLQSGNALSTTGFSIGNGYLLETTESGIEFGDYVNFSANDSGGTLTATPVPFELDATAGILTLGSIWGVNQWRKNRLKK